MILHSKCGSRDNQIDDLLEEIDKRVRKKSPDRLVTTITKRMAEELSKYLTEWGSATATSIRTSTRWNGCRSSKTCGCGMFDVLIGVNLLREGLDLPEAALVAILYADKEGFLRNVRSITHIVGRAARHSNGNVILYADHGTDSMRYAIEQSNRRREKTDALQHGARNAPDRRRKAARDRAPCWQIRFRHPSRMEIP